MLAFLGQSSVRAEEIALTFDLPAARSGQPESPSASAPEPSPSQEAAASPETQPPETEVAALLPVPEAAANPPVQSGSNSVPGKTYGGGESLAMADQTTAAASLLPPPPPLPAALMALIAPEAPPVAVQPTAKAAKPPLEPIALNFAIAPNAAGMALAQAQQPAPESVANPEPAPLVSIFEGGSESLVARVVGSAEGTRTATGERTSAFYGHVDPGNGVWNLGTFSYQHGANTPEEADGRQLRRLQAQSEIIRRKALDHGLELSLKETLNGIDLANQAPIAALGKGSYVDWLAQARQLGMAEEEAIVWARTRSFLDPDTQRWNAPGLGNNINSISRDQERRMLAIARSLEAYQAQNPDRPLPALALAPNPTPEAAPVAAAAPAPTTEAAVDSFLKQDQPAEEPTPAAAPEPEPAGLNFAPGLAASSQPSDPAAATPAESTAAEVREGAQSMAQPAEAASEDPVPAAATPAEAVPEGAIPSAVVYPPASAQPLEIPAPLNIEPSGSAEEGASPAAPTSLLNLQGAIPLPNIDSLLFHIDV